MRLSIEREGDYDPYMRDYEDWNHCVVAHVFTSSDFGSRSLPGMDFKKMWNDSNFRMPSGIMPTHWEECLTPEQYGDFTGNDPTDQTETDGVHHTAKFYSWDGRQLCEIDDFKEVYNFVVILVPKQNDLEKLVAAGSGWATNEEQIDSVAVEVASVARGEVYYWMIVDEEGECLESCGGYIGEEGYALAQEEGRATLNNLKEVGDGE